MDAAQVAITENAAPGYTFHLAGWMPVNVEMDRRTQRDVERGFPLSLLLLALCLAVFLRSIRGVLIVNVAVVLAAGWFVVKAVVRSHVDGLIQQSVGRQLPEFRLVDRAGKVWTHADLAGRCAVLHFFRSRCHSCDVEAPAIRELEARLPPDVVMLHVMNDAVLAFPAELTTQTLAAKEFRRPVLMADAAFVDAFHQVRWSNVTPITYAAFRPFCTTALFVNRPNSTRDRPRRSCATTCRRRSSIRRRTITPTCPGMPRSPASTSLVPRCGPPMATAFPAGS